MSVLYPIAASADAALKAPLGRAARARDAGELIHGPVAFARDLTGPAFDTREAAAAAWAGRIDVEGAPAVAPEDRYCELMEIAAPGKAAAGGQAEPVYEAGHRWPKPKRLLKTAWRLSVSYWRTVDGEPVHPAVQQARQARRREGAETLDAAALRAMASQPLAPVKPQQPLDIGLFEIRPPDAPHIIMPDE